MVQTGPSVTWKALAVVALVAAAGVLLGCGGPPTPAAGVPVKIALKGKEAVEVQCGDLDTAGLIAVTRFTRAREAKQDEYEITLFPGSLVIVDVKTKVGGKTRTVAFPYIYGGKRARLAFEGHGFRALLNGQTVFVDLTDSDAPEWLRKAPAAELRTIRSIRLSGDRKTDAAALSRFVGSGVFVVLDKKFSAKDQPEVLKALAAARPTGLMAEEVQGLQEILDPLGDLSHLVAGGTELPDLSRHPKLKCLVFAFRKDGERSLAPLAKAGKLECLFLSECGRVKDLRPVAALKGLRSLGLADCENVKDLCALSGLASLRCLTLSGCEDLADISAIAKLPKLSQVAIVPVPEEVKDLTPLTRLKNLKVLLVDAKGLEKRKSEYDQIRKALPDCEIIGFCMGSAWVLAVVSAGVVLGRLWRRRLHPRQGPVGPAELPR